MNEMAERRGELRQLPHARLLARLLLLLRVGEVVARVGLVGPLEVSVRVGGREEVGRWRRRRGHGDPFDERGLHDRPELSWRSSEREAR